MTIEELQKENLELKDRLYRVETYLNQVIKSAMQNRETQSAELMKAKNKINDNYQKFQKELNKIK